MGEHPKKTGPNQHYIPQMLLRRFGELRKKGGRKIYNVLICRKKRHYVSATNKVCSESYFYSEKGDKDGLDAQITAYESKILDILLDKINNYEVNCTVDCNVAAEVVTHLALRTAHLRKGFASGIKRLTAKLSTEVDLNSLVSKRLGLDKGVPSVYFTELIAEHLDNMPDILKYQIPRDVIIKALFFRFREDKKLWENAASFFKSLLLFFEAHAESQSESGHKKALLLSQAPQAHIDYLCKFNWKVQSAPEGGAILPDCVVIAIANNGESNPYIFRQQKSDRFIILPIGSEKILIGSKTTEHFQLDYNVLAAKACDSFFVCNPQFSNIETLQADISVSAKNTLFSEVDRAINKVKVSESDFTIRVEKKHADKLTIRFLHGYDGNATEKIARNISSLIHAISYFVSTGFVEGIIFTDTNFYDVFATMQPILQEYHIKLKEEQLNEKGITFQVTQREDGNLGYFIICDYKVADALCRDEIFQNKLAYDFVYNIACLSILNNDYSPLRDKVGNNKFDDRLYTIFEAYLGARIARSIVNVECDIFLKDAIGAHDALQNILPQERTNLETHQDGVIFLEKTTVVVERFLRNVAILFGNLHSIENIKIDEFNVFLGRIRSNMLEEWIYCYENDLINAFEMFINTGDNDSFLNLSLHFERIYAAYNFFIAKDNSTYTYHALPFDASIVL